MSPGTRSSLPCLHTDSSSASFESLAGILLPGAFLLLRGVPDVATSSGMKSEQPTRGVHHVGLTVSNIQECRDFFVQVLGYEQVGEKPAYPALFVSDGTTMITLWQARDGAREFDREHAIGLHHLAVRASSREELGRLHQKIAEHKDCSVEFPPEPLGTSGLLHMMARIPGGVRLELVG